MDRAYLSVVRITTWNVNGLRAALRKGFAEVIDMVQPDVLLLQEIRSTPEQLPDEWAEPDGWHVTWHPAQKLGYAGTAVWTRQPHRVLERGMKLKEAPRRAEGDPVSDDVSDEALDLAADRDGRVIRVSVEGLQAVSVYLPSGSSSPERQVYKEAWMQHFRAWMDQTRKRRGPLVVAGDLNIAPKAQDLFYDKGNKKQSGFLPHEREWLLDLCASGWTDSVRHHFGDIEGPYTWWSNRGQARKLDRGWRIDHLLTNLAATKTLKATVVHREESLAVSDHAPVSLDLEI